MGVAHLAYTLANQVYVLQGKELDISRSDVKCAEVAGVHTPPSVTIMVNTQKMQAPHCVVPISHFISVLGAACGHGPCYTQALMRM